MKQHDIAATVIEREGDLTVHSNAEHARQPARQVRRATVCPRAVQDVANDEGGAVTPSREDWDDAWAKHKLLDSEQVAALLGVSSTRLCTWRGEGKGPPFIKLETKLVRYRLASVLRWLAQQEVRPIERYPEQRGFKRA